MPTSLRIVQVCLFLLAAVAVTGGSIQMVLGQPDTTPRLDNDVFQRVNKVEDFHGGVGSP